MLSVSSFCDGQLGCSRVGLNTSCTQSLLQQSFRIQRTSLTSHLIRKMFRIQSTEILCGDPGQSGSPSLPAPAPRCSQGYKRSGNEGHGHLVCVGVLGGAAGSGHLLNPESSPRAPATERWGARGLLRPEAGWSSSPAPLLGSTPSCTTPAPTSVSKQRCLCSNEASPTHYQLSTNRSSDLSHSDAFRYGSC